MGTDIHCVWQKKNKDNTWSDVKADYSENRDYYLFAWLAGVRNYIGFAGLNKPLIPISEPRGLPNDFQVDDINRHTTTPEALADWRKKHCNHNKPTIWMGDHNFSWLTWDEILAAGQTDVRTGNKAPRYFVDIVAKLKEQHGEGRLVFGFDS